MEEARVLARLDRIDALDREGAAPGELLAELRGLLREAESWTREHERRRKPNERQRGGGRAPTHGAGTGHNRHVICHWDEVETGRGEAGHIAGRLVRPRRGRGHEDGRPEADPHRPRKMVDAVPPAERGGGDLLRPRRLGHLPARDSAFEVRPGDCIVHRVREAHTLRAGDDGLDVLAFGTRVGTEVGVPPAGGSRLDRRHLDRGRHGRPPVGPRSRGSENRSCRRSARGPAASSTSTRSKVRLKGAVEAACPVGGRGADRAQLGPPARGG